MVKDYIIYRTEDLNILGHRVKAITERFSDEYLNSERFEPRCTRCCFFNKKDKSICGYITCNSYSIDIQTHFELVDDERNKS